MLPPRFTIDAPMFRMPEDGQRFGRPGEIISDWRIPSDGEHRCRRLIERVGWFLAWERDLDTAPYNANSIDPNTKAHLFSYDFDVGRSRAIGATCFRWREWSNHEPTFCLEWVWLHPYFRRQGILTRSWSAYRAEYGDFAIGPPISRGMLDFLIKVDHPHTGTSWEKWKDHPLCG